MAEFERALTETRASVTPEMEHEYEQIQESLKQDARGAGGGIGFIAPGHAHPAGAEGAEDWTAIASRRPARPQHQAASRHQREEGQERRPKP